MAQMPENMMFSGISTTKVSTMEITTPSDTVAFAMTGMTQGSLTLPAMKGMATIPSFTIHNITFSMSGGLVVTLPEQTFAATVTTDGGEKTIKGTSISGTYNILENAMDITAVFTYGNMPMPVTYHITAYYIKPVTNKVTVVVGGAYPYTNESVTYRIRQYKEEGETLLDVEIPQFSLSGTVMGDLTLGTYTVKGLRYDNERGGFFRDYRFQSYAEWCCNNGQGVPFQYGERQQYPCEALRNRCCRDCQYIPNGCYAIRHSKHIRRDSKRYRLYNNRLP